MPRNPPLRICLALAFGLPAAGCGGGSSGNVSSTAPASVLQVSTTSNLAAGCGTAVGSAADAYTPDSAVQPQLASGTIVVSGVVPPLYGAWEQDRWNAIGSRAIEFASSQDGGRSWAAPQPLPFSVCGGGSGAGASYDRASDPSLSTSAASGGSVVYASALAFSAGNYLASGGTSAVLVTRSADSGATWDPPTAVIADAGAGSGPYYFDDRDAIAADPNSPRVYLVWDRIPSVATASGTAMLSRSLDGGQTWSTPATTIFDPGAGNQSFNNQVQVLPNGTVVDIFTLFQGFAISLVEIVSVDDGATWSTTPVTIAPTVNSVGTADPIPGGAPIRDSSNMAQTAVDPAGGNLAAVWQDSSFSAGARDGIVFSLSVDGGASWSAPVRINTAASVAAFNPTVHFGNGGTIAVTYYDFREYTSGSTVLKTDLWLLQSADNGSTWTETRLYGPFDLTKAPPADSAAGSTGNALFLGDQQGLAWNGAAFVPLFAAATAQGARVFSTASP